MYWLIQNNIFKEPFYDKMISFFEKMDIEYEIVKAVPFTGEMIPEPKPTQEYVLWQLRI